MKHVLAFLIVIFSIITTSCDKKEVSQEFNKPASSISSDTLHLDIQQSLKPSIPLTLQAQEGVKNWLFYNNLTTTIDSLQVPTLGALRKQLVNLDVLYIEQEEAEEAVAPVTPQDVQTKAINARLVAIETKAKVLQNSVQLNTPDATDISKKTADLYNAFQNLNLQLNELFDTSFKDLLEEIKQENLQAAGEKADEQIPD